MGGIDASRPAAQVLEAACGKLASDARGRHHDAGRRTVEAAQQPIAPGLGKAEAGGDVFREPRAIGGGERDGAPHAITARRQPERSFGDDVDGIGRDNVEALRHALARADRQANLRIKRARHRREEVRRDRRDVMTGATELAGQRRQCPDDAVHLRPPGIADQRYSHRPPAPTSVVSSSSALASSLGCSGSSERSSIQWTTSKRPSKCSTRAVQLSTQSPSLQ